MDGADGLVVLYGGGVGGRREETGLFPALREGLVFVSQKA